MGKLIDESNFDEKAFCRVKDHKEENLFIEKKSTWRSILDNIKGNKLVILSFILITIIILASALAPISPWDPDAVDVLNKLQKPSKEHIFGTDSFGRDYFTRALYGGRVSLKVGVFSMMVSMIVGTLYGTISGYVGGIIDTIMMRLVDIFMSIPSFLLIIIISAFVTPGITTMIFIIGIFSWMGVARILRAETMSLKQRDFVLVSRGLGSNHLSIIFRHIIPNLIPSIIVSSSISIARSILTESALSYLGFGVQLPMASWGSMLQNAQSLTLHLPYLAVFPGILIIITVMSFNVLGDFFRDILDSKGKNRYL
ncbi:ABC transporter permease [Paraclostridium bifermentans]|uniref:ABC transporter permease n=1 Tax=Paraclostridium bifermentans TaxID=1490 RepID=UPI003D281F13